MTDNQTRSRIARTSELKKPNIYVQKLQSTLQGQVFDEHTAEGFRGLWRQKVFGNRMLFEKAEAGESEINMDRSGLDKMPLDKVALDKIPLDVECGTGNGLHFAHRASLFPDRLLVGLEVKYKPLIQSAERALRAGSKNACMARFHVHNLGLLFQPGEVDDVFVHFPDPWVTPRKPERRMLGPSMWRSLSVLQKPGSRVEFKTDSRELFDWVLKQSEQTPYQLLQCHYDLHAEEKTAGGPGTLVPMPFRTGFERIFIQQGIPIGYAQWVLANG